MGKNNGTDRSDSQNKADQDNHANQLNENNDAYHQSRGEEARPDDWQQSESK